MDADAARVWARRINHATSLNHEIADEMDKNGVDTWGFEGMSPNYLGRRGWTKSTLKPGDKISVTFRPLRDGSKGGMFVSAARPNGEMLRMTGEPTDKY